MSSLLSAEAVREALKRIVDPDLRHDVVSLGFIRALEIDAGRVSVTIELPTFSASTRESMREQKCPSGS